MSLHQLKGKEMLKHPKDQKKEAVKIEESDDKKSLQEQLQAFNRLMAKKKPSFVLPSK